MTLLFPQTKFEAVPPRDVGGVAYLAQTDTSNQILGFSENILSSGSYESDFPSFEIPVKRPFQKIHTVESCY